MPMSARPMVTQMPARERRVDEADEERERHRYAEAAVDGARFVARLDRREFDVRQARRRIAAARASLRPWPQRG